MNCEQVKDLLSAYLDDQLTAYERQSVDAHLPSCLQCNAILADYRRLDALLSRLPRVSPPPDQRNRILVTTGSVANRVNRENPNSHGHLLQCMPRLLPVDKPFSEQPTMAFTQMNAKLYTSRITSTLLHENSKRSFFSLQPAFILIILCLTSCISLLLIYSFWQKRH